MLFLYSYHLCLLHYSYMELEPSFCKIITICTFAITLFLYGIGAWLKLFNSIPFLNITLFLYGIGAISYGFIISPLILITLFLYGIGAFYNRICCCLFLFITLFLYGIGAFTCSASFTYPIPYYIIPIWNWSNLLL